MGVNGAVAERRGIMGSEELRQESESRREIFEKLYPEFEQRLVHQLSGSKFDEHTSAEIIQEVMLRSWRKWNGREESLWPFMKSALRLVIFEALRIVAADKLFVGFGDEGPESCATSATSPGRKAMRRDLIARLRHDAADRIALEIFYMKEVGELTFEALANDLDMERDDVKRRYYQVCEWLQRRYGGADI